MESQKTLTDRVAELRNLFNTDKYLLKRGVNKIKLYENEEVRIWANNDKRYIYEDDLVGFLYWYSQKYNLDFKYKQISKMLKKYSMAEVDPNIIDSHYFVVDLQEFANENIQELFKVANATTDRAWLDMALKHSLNLEWNIDDTNDFPEALHNEMVDHVVQGVYKRHAPDPDKYYKDPVYDNRIQNERPYYSESLEYMPGEYYGSLVKTKDSNWQNEYDIMDRPFVCTVPGCQRAFKRLEHLKRHTRIHTGEKPFKCTYPGCYKSFSRSDNLTQHLKVHGSNEEYNMEHMDMLDFRHRNK